MLWLASVRPARIPNVVLSSLLSLEEEDEEEELVFCADTDRERMAQAMMMISFFTVQSFSGGIN